VGVVAGRDGQAEDLRLARAERLEGFRKQPAEGLAAAPSGHDQPGGAEPAHVPRHERLRQPDLRDELRDGRLAVRQAPDDPEPVDVGERLVDETQLAQLIWLEDGVGDRAANVGAGGAQGELREGDRRINDGLYQWGLILATLADRCQAPRRELARPVPDDGVDLTATSDG
jgi:hypothetical protein